MLFDAATDIVAARWTAHHSTVLQAGTHDRQSAPPIAPTALIAKVFDHPP
jgi:hypothetical protein